MMMVWLRGLHGGPTDYYHSEGACCKTDTVEGVPEAHTTCMVDVEYTLRRALQAIRNTEYVPYLESFTDIAEAYTHFALEWHGELPSDYIAFVRSWIRERQSVRGGNAKLES